MHSSTRRRFLIATGGTVLGTGLIGTAQACHARTDWRTFQYDATNRGFAPDDIGPSKPTPEIQWRVQTGGAIYSAPAVINDAYFGTENGCVFAVDAEDGTPDWARQLTAPVTTTPTVEHDTVYVGTEDGLVIALAAGGSIRWYQWIEGPVSSPTFAEDTVYITGGDGIHAFDARTGDELWHNPLEEISFADSTPAVTPDTVYVSDQWYVYALDATTGEERWRYRPAEAHGASESPPIIVDNTLYAIGGFRRVHAIDASDGSQLAEFSAEVNHIAVDNRWVYAQFIDGLSVWSHDGETSEWAFTVEEGGAAFPAIAGDTVYFVDPPGAEGQNTVHALNAVDGTERWRLTPDIDIPNEIGRAHV